MAMAEYCFAVVKANMERRPTPVVPTTIPDVPCPIFVCFKNAISGDLRGCIGNFSALPLHQQLVSYANAAAFGDSRFTSITLSELPQLKCTVSLLHSFEDCRRWDDWDVGTHGIEIELSVKDSSYRGTFLPSVAKEQQWTKAVTMQRLVAKAGYRGTANEDLFRSIHVRRYQESTAALAFTDARL